jgi:dual specificity MAP kinase phosphatase
MPSPSTPATSLGSPPSSCIPLEPPSPEPQPRTAPLIAHGFKPRDLLQLNADGNAEFIPLRVPDGISLRNFDIQLVRVLLSYFRRLRRGVSVVPSLALEWTV